MKEVDFDWQIEKRFTDEFVNVVTADAFRYRIRQFKNVLEAKFFNREVSGLAPFLTKLLLCRVFDLSSLKDLSAAEKLTLEKWASEACRGTKIYAIKEVVDASAEKKKTHDTKKLLDVLLKLRNDAREVKNYALADKIKDSLESIGIKVTDSKGLIRCHIE